MILDDGREYLELDACARRMKMTEERVLELVRIRALRATDLGWGPLVEPAIINRR